jgi:hypothetical protein
VGLRGFAQVREGLKIKGNSMVWMGVFNGEGMGLMGRIGRIEKRRSATTSVGVVKYVFTFWALKHDSGKI